MHEKCKLNEAMCLVLFAHLKLAEKNERILSLSALVAVIGAVLLLLLRAQISIIKFSFSSPSFSSLSGVSGADTCGFILSPRAYLLESRKTGGTVVVATVDACQVSGRFCVFHNLST
jgi:hypothetical protein